LAKLEGCAGGEVGVLDQGDEGRVLLGAALGRLPRQELRGELFELARGRRWVAGDLLPLHGVSWASAVTTRSLQSRVEARLDAHARRAYLDDERPGGGDL
jgi:hypothetical protein